MAHNYDISERYDFMIDKYKRKKTIKAFMPHEMLELLLDFSEPPCADTNFIAHTLINTQGSFKKVLDLGYGELTDNYGISSRSAVLITLIRNISMLRRKVRFQRPNISFDSFQSIIEYIDSFMNTESNEKTYMIFLDLNFKLLKTVCISYDGIDGLFMKNIARDIVSEPLKYAVVVRGTSSVDISPSPNDISKLNELKLFFQFLDCHVCDYIIFSTKEHFLSFNKEKLYSFE